MVFDRSATWMGLAGLILTVSPALAVLEAGAAVPEALIKKTCLATTYGARADGVTINTRAIQAAIDDCAAADGGQVVLRGGVFVSGTIRLKSGISLVVEPTATLKGSRDPLDYPDLFPVSDNRELKDLRKALVYSEKATDISLSGGGTIDGSGDAPQWVGGAVPPKTRPALVWLAQSTGVTVKHLKIRNAAMWGVVNFENEQVVVRDLDIVTLASGNRDGIDVVDSHHVLIEGNTISSEDDAICLKSGNARGVRDVVVRRNSILQSTIANGLKLGTASVGSFTDISFEDNDVANVDKAAMAIESVDGAAISNVSFKRIRFANAGAAVYVILGKRARGMGTINGVRFDDVRGDQRKHGWGSLVSGTTLEGRTYMPKGIVFRDFHLTARGGSVTVPAMPPEFKIEQYPEVNNWGDLPASGIFFRHVEGLVFERSDVQLDARDARPAVVRADVSGFAR